MAFGRKEKVKVEKSGIGTIESTVRAIQNKYGEGAILMLGQRPKVGVDAIPTGSLSLDAALGIGGVPRGRVI